MLARMEAEIVERGCTHAYGPIVTTHGEVLHDERHDRELPERGLLLADVGAETREGWASDVTRTWPTNGRYSESQRAIYDVVLEAQRAAIAAVRPGVRYLDVHRTAGKALLGGLIALGIYRGDLEELYARGAAALFFPHGVGHLIGLDVHDMEDLGDRAGYAPGRARIANFGDRYLRLDRDLVPGMAVTIEPGFYRIPMLLEHPEEVGDLESALDRRCSRATPTCAGSASRTTCSSRKREPRCSPRAFRRRRATWKRRRAVDTPRARRRQRRFSSRASNE